MGEHGGPRADSRPSRDSRQINRCRKAV